MDKWEKMGLMIPQACILMPQCGNYIKDNALILPNKPPGK